jgi:hypothetical protein
VLRRDERVIARAGIAFPLLADALRFVYLP